MLGCKSRASSDSPSPLASKDLFVIDAGNQMLSISGPSLSIPTGWPTDVPVYPNAHISQSSTGDGGRDWQIMFETPDAPAAVEAYYRRMFTGMKTLIDLGMMGTRTFAVADDKKSVSVLIVSLMGETHVTLAVQPP
jgi:hypothetical protein